MARTCYLKAWTNLHYTQITPICLSPTPPSHLTYFISQIFISFWASLVAQTVMNLPAVQETWDQFLGQEGCLEKGVATHSSILVWRIPWTKELGRLQSMGLQRVGHDWVTNTPLASIPSLGLLASLTVSTNLILYFLNHALSLPSQFTLFILSPVIRVQLNLNSKFKEFGLIFLIVQSPSLSPYSEDIIYQK